MVSAGNRSCENLTAKSRECEKLPEAFQVELEPIQFLNQACDNLRANA